MDAPPPLPSQDKVMMKPMEEMITKTRTKEASTPQERKLVVRHEKDDKAIILDCPCPRCHSSNTKFCYYNNYSLTQPRYFCKACKRYWTQGGSLRSIPVGGKARKNKRPSSSSSLSSSKFKIPDLVESSSNIANILTNPNPKFIHHPQDLNLGFTPNLLQLPISDHFIYNQQTINSSVMAPFLPMVSYQNPVYPVGLSLDGIGSGGRILFPFEDLMSPKSTTTATAINANHHQELSTSDQQITRDDPHQHGDSTSYWTGNIF